jgi:hypothetical protein
MTYLDRIYRKSDSIVFRKIGDECILVPIRQGVGDLDSIYTLNETAARIWDLIDGQKKVQEIKDQLLAEYDVTPFEAEKDLLGHIEQLESIQAVTLEAGDALP